MLSRGSVLLCCYLRVWYDGGYASSLFELLFVILDSKFIVQSAPKKKEKARKRRWKTVMLNKESKTVQEFKYQKIQLQIK